MLVVVSDTHGRDSHRLEGRTLDAVREADLVLHAGDFMTEAVLDAFEGLCDLRGVTGNNDSPALNDRLPETRVVEWKGFRIAMAHGHEHTDTSLALFGRQSNADLVVVGHSHKPGFGHLGELPVLNPGSHADPRWHRPGHAELDVENGALVGKLVEPDGTVFETFRVEKRV